MLIGSAPVAQLDRAVASEAIGREFESLRAHHTFLAFDAIPEMTTPSLPYGLCSHCIHFKRIESSRGSVFVMCQRGLTDERFPKYPRLPVLRCAGFEPGDSATDAPPQAMR